MKRVLTSASLLAICSLASGCVTPGESAFQYAGPRPATVSNETQINEPFDAVWDRLVSRLATGFFVVNNIDKASRLINVSYSSDSPEQLVDCGRSTRQFSFNNEHHTYTYEVAADSAFKSTGRWGPYQNLPVVYEMSRDTSVEGRINLYVAPVDAQHTKISANVKYILQVTVKGIGTGYNAFGQIADTVQMATSKSDISFTSSEPGTKNWGTPASEELITCRSNGKLEEELLDKGRP